jgi:hypothetical protein
VGLVVAHPTLNQVNVQRLEPQAGDGGILFAQVLDVAVVVVLGTDWRGT